MILEVCRYTQRDKYHARAHTRTHTHPGANMNTRAPWHQRMHAVYARAHTKHLRTPCVQSLTQPLALTLTCTRKHTHTHTVVQREYRARKVPAHTRSTRGRLGACVDEDGENARGIMKWRIDEVEFAVRKRINGGILDGRGNEVGGSLTAATPIGTSLERSRQGRRAGQESRAEVGQKRTDEGGSMKAGRREKRGGCTEDRRKNE